MKYMPGAKISLEASNIVIKVISNVCMLGLYVEYFETMIINALCIS